MTGWLNRPNAPAALLLALAAGAAALGGCTAAPGTALSNLTAEGRLLNRGPPARLTADAVAANRADTVPLLYAFAVEAGQVPPSEQPPADPAAQQLALAGVRDWPAVTLVGEGYVDTQCAAFLSALDALERQKRAALANLNAGQSAAVGIMGLAIASQKAIGIVGIAFGLAASLFDNTTSAVLYELPAASIRSIVASQRDALRNQEADWIGRVTNQGLAGARVSEYVQYCVPVAIEANVARILNNARFIPDPGGANTGTAAGAIVVVPTPPAITSALAPVISAIPPGVPRVMFAPTAPADGTIASAAVQRRRVALAGALRQVTARDTLDAIAAALGIAGGTALDTPALRARIRVEVTARTSDAAGMDEISRRLRPFLGASF